MSDGSRGPRSRLSGTRIVLARMSSRWLSRARERFSFGNLPEMLTITTPKITQQTQNNFWVFLNETECDIARPTQKPANLTRNMVMIDSKSITGHIIAGKTTNGATTILLNKHRIVCILGNSVRRIQMMLAVVCPPTIFPLVPRLCAITVSAIPPMPVRRACLTVECLDILLDPTLTANLRNDINGHGRPPFTRGLVLTFPTPTPNPIVRTHAEDIQRSHTLTLPTKLCPIRHVPAGTPLPARYIPPRALTVLTPLMKTRNGGF